MIRTAHYRLSNQSGSGVSPLCFGVMIDSRALASPSLPSFVFTAHIQPNVRKCPVLSGPIDPSGQTNASTDKKTTCAQNLSHPDQTSTGHQPAKPPLKLPVDWDRPGLRQERRYTRPAVTFVCDSCLRSHWPYPTDIPDAPLS